MYISYFIENIEHFQQKDQTVNVMWENNFIERIKRNT